MRLNWNEPGQKFYEAGIDRGVLFVGENPGVAWNGLISMVESQVGGEIKSYYLDGVSYLNTNAPEEFKGTLTAFYSPREFDECDGILSFGQGLQAYQQKRTPFNLCYRTNIGSDLAGTERGYKIHIIYNALAEPSDRSHNTMGQSTDPDSLSWDIYAKPVNMFSSTTLQGFRSAHITVDSLDMEPSALARLEAILYGTDENMARLPQPAEIAEIANPFTVLDNLDGTFTVIGSEDSVSMINQTTFQLDAPEVIDHGDGTWTATSRED